MRLGVHIRIAGGLVKALDRAVELKCEAVQLFSGNPNSWIQKPADLEALAKFADRTAELDIHPVILHTPYLLNLATSDDEIWAKSRNALADAVYRAQMMRASYVVTHIGSHKGLGYESGIIRIREAVESALDAAPNPIIALELGAGAGNSIGSRFEHIADILDSIKCGPERIGICIDTAHLWGSGYDISTALGVQNMFNTLHSYVGFDKLKVVHLNDTVKDLGSHIDRHHHIGKGQVGVEGFRAIVNYPGTQFLPGIIETPGESLELDKENLAVLRALRADI